MKPVPPQVVFVFGSNLAGIHGAGSAREAFDKWGAKWGVGIGFHGASYAIPTKGRDLHAPLPLNWIKPYVDDFVEFSREHPEMRFRCVAVGCGLAGYTAAQMAPLFKYVPTNVDLPFEFRHALEKK